jgi:predicted alpha/beta superfamily hydrolase
MGGSGKFIKFLSNELKSLIESKYRISDDSTLVGQSLGGLLATEILFTHADLFDRYVIISPSLWWNDEYWLSIPYQPSSSVKSIYIGVGKEGKLMERVAKGLFTKIKAQSTSTQLNFEYFDTLTHGDVLHNALYDAFKKTNY